MYSRTHETEWKPTNDGKGSWRRIGDYRLVVKHQPGTQDDPDWWWGVYEDEYDDLQEDGHEPTEEAAREAAEDIAFVL